MTEIDGPDHQPAFRTILGRLDCVCREVTEGERLSLPGKVVCLKSGLLKVIARTGNAPGHLLYFVEPGELLAEDLTSSAADDIGYEAVVQRDSVVLEVQRQAFIEALLEEPAAGLEVLRVLEKRLTTMLLRLELLAGVPAPRIKSAPQCEVPNSGGGRRTFAAGSGRSYA